MARSNLHTALQILDASAVAPLSYRFPARDRIQMLPVS